MPDNAETVGDAIARATESLKEAAVESPRLDAELMLAAATGISRERFAAEPEAALPSGPARAFGQMVRRRTRREPVAYITGRKWFRELELAVDSRVLIPRPETELLVELALELRPASVLDVGTGSGAVALAVASELPEAEVTATDTSAAALELARENAARLGLDDRVRFATGTLPARGTFELLLANLPYVGEAEWPDLAPEIREYEPRIALVPGPSGMEAIGSMLARLAAVPDLTRTLALEIGAGQAKETAELMKEAGFGRTETRADLAGVERVVVGHRPG
jgi:release factor glutamine methyltransferase